MLLFCMSEKREISTRENFSVRQERLSWILWAHVLISKVFFAGMTIANSKVERSLQ
jgi:hypothetical protein